MWIVLTIGIPIVIQRGNRPDNKVTVIPVNIERIKVIGEITKAWRLENPSVYLKIKSSKPAKPSPPIPPIILPNRPIKKASVRMRRMTCFLAVPIDHKIPNSFIRSFMEKAKMFVINRNSIK